MRNWAQSSKTHLGLPSAPIETSLTPLLVMKSKALLTLLILWTLILPRSGLGSRSPADANVQLKTILTRTDSLQIWLVRMSPCYILRLTWDDLQQEHKFQPIPEVLLDVFDLCSGLPQMGVTPRSERLHESTETPQKPWTFGVRAMFFWLLSQKKSLWMKDD